NPTLSVDHPGQLAASHPVSIRNVPLADEGPEPIFDHRSLDPLAAERVRPIEHKELDARLRARLHGKTHGADERVGAYARVLQVIHQRIEAFQHRGARLARCPGLWVPSPHGSRRQERAARSQRLDAAVYVSAEMGV